jgi:hypothetical protein
MDNKKEGPGNLFGGCSPHWVNHVYLCLYCIVYLMCFISPFVFILLLCDPVFLTSSRLRVNDINGYDIHKTSKPIPYNKCV